MIESLSLNREILSDVVCYGVYGVDRADANNANSPREFLRSELRDSDSVATVFGPTPITLSLFDTS